MVSARELPLCPGTALSVWRGVPGLGADPAASAASQPRGLGGGLSSPGCGLLVPLIGHHLPRVDLRIWGDDQVRIQLRCGMCWALEGHGKAKTLPSLAFQTLRGVTFSVHSRGTLYPSLPFSAQQVLSSRRASVSLREQWAQYSIFYTPSVYQNFRPPWGAPVLWASAISVQEVA